MTPIKVKLIHHPSSVGRGIGFYSEFLLASLRKSKEVIFVDQNEDIIHYTYFDLFYPTLKVNESEKVIVTIHDVTPLVLRELYPKGLKGRLNLFRQKLALKKVAAVITDSQNSKKDIEKHLNVPPHKITVTPLAADPIYQDTPSDVELARVKKKYHLPQEFILYVGGVNPNKNLLSLIEASLSLSIPLVLVGSEFLKAITNARSLKAKIGLQSIHPELKIASMIQNLIVNSPSLYPLGFVPSEELVSIYRLATLYCQPSLYEGFGLPLLEASLSKCLIVSSNTSSLPEVYPEDTLTFNPNESSSLIKTLKTALSLSSKEKESLICKAYKKALTFTWDKTAHATLAVYEHVLKHG